MTTTPLFAAIADLADEELPSIAELPGDLRIMAETLTPFCADRKRAVRAILTLAEEYQGAQIYFHGLNSLLRKIRNRRIKAEYDRGGISGQQLARKYRLSDRQIWITLSSAE